MSDGEAYLDIVWRQFKKNRPAYVCLWLMLLLFLVAIFAPLLASNIPLVFHDGGTTISPWFHWLFHPEEPVDFFYNMALVGFFPWMALAIVTNVWMKTRGVPGRRRLAVVAIEFLAVLTLAIAIFSISSFTPSNPLRDARLCGRGVSIARSESGHRMCSSRLDQRKSMYPREFSRQDSLWLHVTCQEVQSGGFRIFWARRTTVKTFWLA